VGTRKTFAEPQHALWALPSQMKALIPLFLIGVTPASLLRWPARAQG